MLKNYFKIALRGIWKHKLFSFINVFGLALSLAVCMLVLAQVKEDLSYDLFHPYPGRTFRILSDIIETKNNNQYRLASTPLPLMNELSGQANMIEASVQLYPVLKEKANSNEKELYVNGVFTNSSFFKIFGFRLSSGNEQTALSQTNGIVLSNEMAVRFFGTADPLGKILSFPKMGTFQVTGVLAKPSGKSHIDFDAFASSLAIPRLEKAKVLPELQHSWNSINSAYTYVLLKNNTTAKNLNTLLSQIAEAPAFKSVDRKVNFVSQKLPDITPGTDGIYNEIGKGTVWAKLWTIVGIGLVLLLAACFNYTNLTIARALTRAKEVGIRKVAGATRGHIFLQYIVESVLIALFALVLACILLLEFKPAFLFTPSLLMTVLLFYCAYRGIGGGFPSLDIIRF